MRRNQQQQQEEEEEQEGVGLWGQPRLLLCQQILLPLTRATLLYSEARSCRS